MAKKLVFTTNNPSASTDYAAADGTWKTYTGGGGGGAGSILHGTASGTDTYAVSITGVTSYADGDAYLVRFTNGNTTGATLNVNSLGAIPLYRNNDGQLIGGDIIAGGEMLCVYNSTTSRFQVIGTAPNTLLAYVTNVNGSTITKGQPVYAFGGQGDRLTVKLASNTTDATSAQTVGMVISTSIANNQKGLIILNGQLDGLSILPTSTWADGDPIYLGATAGSITNVKPFAPNHLVYLGFVTTANNGSAGRMYVRVQNGYEMQELHNVSAQSPANNDILVYNTTTSLWEKSNALSTKQNTVSLTTTGTSGAATFNPTTGALNIPQYSSSPVYAKSLTTYSSSGTGTQIIHNLLIPANTFGAGDILRITTRWKKVGTASASQCNVIINTSIASSGATNIKPQVIAASTVATSNQTHVGIISNTTNTQYIWNTNNQSLTDFFSNTNVFQENVATNWTTNQYIMFQCNPASTDVVSLIFYMIEKL